MDIVWSISKDVFDQLTKLIIDYLYGLENLDFRIEIVQKLN